MTNYNTAKQYLKEIADQAKARFPKDKPAIRQIINDNAYILGREYRLTEAKRNMLHNYACKLHPKQNK